MRARSPQPGSSEADSPAPDAESRAAAREAGRLEPPPGACADSFAAAEEARLVARILAGEGRLYGQLVERYQRRLYWSCLRLLGDPDDAEDVVQEAFVRAYAHLREFDPAFRFYTWIFRIARNLSLNRLRRRRLWGFVSLSGPGPAAEVEAPDDPVRDVASRELAEALGACLETLPREQRECFGLRHAEDLSYAEIAEILRVPVGTVMSRLSRAREKMRACLESRGIHP
jgi:RNA polymerase sigma-70 factor (ECF subfamily)